MLHRGAGPAAGAAILLATASPAAAGDLRAALRRFGHEVHVAGSAKETLSRITDGPLLLVVLSMQLPGTDGLELLRRIREVSRVPVIAVASDDHLQVAALREGADDFLTTPLRSDVLFARAEAILRRVGAALPAETILRSGPFVIDLLARRVGQGGQTLHLSAGEFALLAALVAQPGATRSPAELTAEVWGEPDRTSAQLRVYIWRLRRALGDDAAEPRYIQTVPGEGYRWIA